MPEWDETVPDEPLAVLENASAHIDKGEEHMDRADELSTEAEEELRDELDNALPNEVLVDVDAEVDADSHQFVVNLYDESTEDSVNEFVGGDADVGTPHP
ncbi:hypothetical protein EGH21_21485 [Halomicroarcula sp. F13]|uniref:Halobacterial output domain-containing protein n=1 Tax=Haloarcula rubra TaxID=2487747 RepID=A0AAW4PY65_9EURY|nr:hypothetical protein [Halomicroarcula rubra]MBX0325599.1 hypothetical protein [Halomicroarcula rubra]